MKDFLKVFLKAVIVLALSVIVTYILLTLWTNRIQFSFSEMANNEVINSLDKQTINGLESNVSKGNLPTAILFGILITLSYIIIINKRLSTSAKIIIGYFSIIIFFPPLYMLSFTGKLDNVHLIYENAVPTMFYKSCTIIFLLMYFINYKINSKITDELNEMLQNKESTPRKVGKNIAIMLALTVIILLLISLLWFAIDNYNKYTIFKESINKVKSIQENGNYYYEVSASDYYGSLDCKMWVKGNKAKIEISVVDSNRTSYFSQYKNRVLVDEDNSKVHKEIYYLDFDKRETYCANEELKTYRVKNELVMKELKPIKLPKVYRILTKQEDITFFDFIEHVEDWESSRSWSYDPTTKEEANHYFYIIRYWDVEYQISEKVKIDKETLLPIELHDYPSYSSSESGSCDLIPNCVKDEDVTFNNMSEYTQIEDENVLFKILR